MKPIALILLCCALPVSAQRIDTLEIRGHTRFLSHELLAGRGTGTTGEHIAAQYIASQLERLGLEPLAGNDFLLPIPMKTAIIGPGTRAAVMHRGTTTTLRTGSDFIFNTGGPNAFRDFTGPVVFAGPAASAAASLRAAGDFRGRVIAIAGPLTGAPALVPALIDGGAVGVVVMVPDTAQYDLYVRSRGDRRFFVDADVADPVWQPDLPVILAGPSLTSALLRDSGVTRPLIEGAAGTPALDLDRTITVQLDARFENVHSANVAGVLTGSDPARRSDLVIYTAHYDHLGVSVPDARGDSVFNGFSDNAAGVAMLLAIADAMRAAPPAASVAFIFFSGEERGLLGSAYLAAHPPFPLARIRALINLDAGAPPAPPISWRIAGGTQTPLGPIAAEIGEQAGWTVTLSGASPNSDYWPFLDRGVPAIFIVPGNEWEGTTPEQRDALRRRWDRYHQAGDEWADDFPFAGLGRYADYALRLGLRIAR